MRRLPRSEPLRIAAAAISYGALLGIAQLAAVFNLKLSIGLLLVLVLGSIAYGAAIDRWWVTVIPLAIWLILVLVAYLGDPSCARDCGEDDSWVSLILLSLIVTVIPAGILNAIGFALGRLVRRRQASAARF